MNLIVPWEWDEGTHIKLGGRGVALSSALTEQEAVERLPLLPEGEQGQALPLEDLRHLLVHGLPLVLRRGYHF